MEIFQISEEQKNKIRLYTAASLPDRPGERGMRATEVKSYFYKFIDVLIDAVNRELLNVQGGVSADIEVHDGDEEAHPMLLALISSLREKDGELGDAIVNQIEEHNNDEGAHENLRSLIDNCSSAASEELSQAMQSHDLDEYAHLYLREIIAGIGELARDAYNLASGKSAVHPYASVNAFIEAVNEGASYNVGDVVIFKETNVPDLTVFGKEQTSKPNGDIMLDEDTELEEKKSYYLNGYTFVALESGIDTSKLVSTEELNTLSDNFNERLKNIQVCCESLGSLIEKNGAKIDTKEDAHKKVSSTASAIELANYTEYSFGLITSLAISLPSEETSDFETIVNFRCGAQAATFDAPNEILFQGDDCLDGALYPVSNRLYEINIKRVMGAYVAKVGACDYEVIE